MRLNQHGFTVTELAIAVVLVGVVFTAVFMFMTNSLTQYTTNINRSRLLNSAQIGFDIVTDDIRLSANADENNRWADSHAPSGDFSWQSDGDTLVLASAVQNSNGDILFADPVEYISHKNNVVYFLQGDKLYRRVIASPVSGNAAVSSCPASSATSSCPADKAIMENVQSFSVRYIDDQDQEVDPTDARAISLSATLSKDTFSQPVSVDYTTRMVFRND